MWFIERTFETILYDMIRHEDSNRNILAILRFIDVKLSI